MANVQFKVSMDSTQRGENSGSHPDGSSSHGMKHSGVSVCVCGAVMGRTGISSQTDTEGLVKGSWVLMEPSWSSGRLEKNQMEWKTGRL